MQTYTIFFICLSPGKGLISYLKLAATVLNRTHILCEES
jgi:hypothetical protein